MEVPVYVININEYPFTFAKGYHCSYDSLGGIIGRSGNFVNNTESLPWEAQSPSPKKADKII